MNDVYQLKYKAYQLTQDDIAGTLEGSSIDEVVGRPLPKLDKKLEQMFLGYLYTSALFEKEKYGQKVYINFRQIYPGLTHGCVSLRVGDWLVADPLHGLTAVPHDLFHFYFKKAYDDV